METSTYQTYLDILHDELVPAMGCTEPIAIALTAARAKAHLPYRVEAVEIAVSGNIIKNVKSVVVPGTGGLRGIEGAAAAGIVAGDPDLELEVLSAIGEAERAAIAEFMEKTPITVTEARGDYVLDIGITLIGEGHRAFAHTVGHHTGLCEISSDGNLVFRNEPEENAGNLDRSILSVEGIVEFAETCDISRVKSLLDRQIAYNTAIAKEGLTGKYGAAIGRTMLMSYGDTVHNRAKAWAAAGSDARM
ncbi:MAG: serine dehydratase subunit alpha family protein, partial [Clostridia bacterium]|nr:serine dehydratase subunit alpha family protein [Clostridia bacterium]